jgi:3-hydroxybutyryl-CoA dehydrogenase
VRVLVVGAGLMGAQIGCEYALGGHEVMLVARRPARARERAEAALRSSRELALFSEQRTAAAAKRMSFTDQTTTACDLAVESLPEDLSLKSELLREVARRSPQAVIASNTSSLSIAELGDAIGAPERTVGTHYWNPPLLMPLVELVAGSADAEVVTFVHDALAALGKRPVLVEREVPGFLWNRLQTALVRESVWLVEQGAASPETVDEVIRHGLARRYRHVGLFQAIALGGVETWNRAAANLLPTLSDTRTLADLGRFARDADLAEVATRRDRALAEELIRERSDS